MAIPPSLNKHWVGGGIRNRKWYTSNCEMVRGLGVIALNHGEGSTSTPENSSNNIPFLARYNLNVL